MFKQQNGKPADMHIGGVPVRITRKNVKNLNLRVYPSRREIAISAPRHVQQKVIHSFLQSKKKWIKKHLADYDPPKHPTNPDFTSGEIHRYRGREWKLKVSTHAAAPDVSLNDVEGVIKMTVRPGSDKTKRGKILKEWYRARLKEQIPELIAKWEEPMGVSVNEFGVKQMKTRWGSCNTRDRRIWLNLELARRSPACLEYVVVHEMVHLLERLHNARFYRLMGQFLPDWQEREKKLKGKID